MVFYSQNRVCDPGLFHCHAAASHLFLNERDSDVAIRVRWGGGEWHLPAHRLMLCAMSDVFRTMFATDMVERSGGTLTIDDCSPHTVRQFLRYLYMGNADFRDWTETADLLRVAHKYGVGALVSLCEQHLSASLAPYNACRLYELAGTYELGQLERRASALVLEAGYVVTATEEFLELGPASLHRFLSSRLLIMENECCVLTALRDWAAARCSRNGRPLTRENVLSEMEPFMRHIRWSLIPEQMRTFVPDHVVAIHVDESLRRRASFHVAASLARHLNLLKFVVELGAFHDDDDDDGDFYSNSINQNRNRMVVVVGPRHSAVLNCLKFKVDNHAYVAGFKIVGMFRKDSSSSGPNISSLTLGRDDHRTYYQFNLNSLPWARGATAGRYVWQEMTAYLPFPVRLDPLSHYVLTLTYTSRRTRWPSTRLESGTVATPLSNIHFHCCSECYGITQLFILPAPPVRNICNDLDAC